MSHEDDLDNGVGSSYGARLETLRSAVRWLLGAAAGVGALLVAGLQLTGIGQLPVGSWRLYAALLAGGVSLLSIGYVIKAASTVLTQEWLTLADFTDETTGLPGPWGRRSPVLVDLRIVENYLAASRHELFGHVAPTLGELHRGLNDCHESMWSENLTSDNREQLARRSGELRRAASDVVHAANYYYVLTLFKDLRARIAWASVIGIVGVAVFAYAINPPTHDAPVEVHIMSTHQVVP